MHKIKFIGTAAALSIFITGCSTTSPTVAKVEKPTVVKPKKIIQQKEEPILKRKVAIARFGNEAQYGKSALFGVNNDYNAEKQATDILSAKLANSGKFILLERNDIDLLNKEINTIIKNRCRLFNCWFCYRIWEKKYVRYRGVFSF